MQKKRCKEWGPWGMERPRKKLDFWQYPQCPPWLCAQIMWQLSNKPDGLEGPWKGILTGMTQDLSRRQVYNLIRLSFFQGVMPHLLNRPSVFSVHTNMMPNNHEAVGGLPTFPRECRCNTSWTWICWIIYPTLDKQFLWGMGQWGTQNLRDVPS